MKKTILALSLISLAACQNQKKDEASTTVVKQAVAKNATANPDETVKSFLSWYQKNSKSLNKFVTVGGGGLSPNNDPVNYYVNMPQVDEEISFLKNSQLFSDQYLSDFKKKYELGQDYFRKNPQNDGPPYGFDYDQFFLTQDDFSSDLDNLKQIEFKTVSADAKTAEVDFGLPSCGMNYKYLLTKNGDKWQIDKIESVTQ